MEEQNQAGEETGQFKQWLQDNLRIIVSILIVVAIAGGIYSYSKRTPAPFNEQTSQKSVSGEGIEEGIVTEATDEKSAQEKTAESKPVVQEKTSQETEGSFIESAGQGEGMTHLARRALANHLEKNPDSSLTPEHKIYIEDYLRKNVPKKRIFVGTSVEFSKDLIQNAIAKSKNLNENQLKNLQKYSARVPSLS